MINIIQGYVVMLKDDWLIVYNTTRAIYWKQDKLLRLYKFNWIELIANFFYL